MSWSQPMKISLAIACIVVSLSMPALAAPPVPAPGSATAAASLTTPASSSEDRWLWLEDVTGKKSLDWVAQHDARSKKELAESAAFKAMDARFLDILNSNERIPFVDKIGNYYYNFWRDKDHERGLWRRTTLAEYRKEKPAWEAVLDLDALGQTEKENWVLHGVDVLPPDYTRCLMSLSRGGADANV